MTLRHGILIGWQPLAEACGSGSAAPPVSGLFLRGNWFDTFRRYRINGEEMEIPSRCMMY